MKKGRLGLQEGTQSSSLFHTSADLSLSFVLIKTVFILELGVFGLLVFSEKRYTCHAHEALSADFALDRLARLVRFQLAMRGRRGCLRRLTLAAHFGAKAVSLRHEGGLLGMEEKRGSCQ